MHVEWDQESIYLSIYIGFMIYVSNTRETEMGGMVQKQGEKPRAAYTWLQHSLTK